MNHARGAVGDDYLPARLRRKEEARQAEDRKISLVIIEGRLEEKIFEGKV